MARRVETQLQCGVRKFRIFNRVFVLLYQSHVYAGSTEKKVWVIIYLTAGLNLISNVWVQTAWTSSANDEIWCTLTVCTDS